MMNEQQFYFFGQIQTNQTGGQSYSDTPVWPDSTNKKLCFYLYSEWGFKIQTGQTGLQ